MVLYSASCSATCTHFHARRLFKFQHASPRTCRAGPNSTSHTINCRCRPIRWRGEDRTRSAQTRRTGRGLEQKPDESGCLCCWLERRLYPRVDNRSLTVCCLISRGMSCNHLRFRTLCLDRCVAKPRASKCNCGGRTRTQNVCTQKNTWERSVIERILLTRDRSKVSFCLVKSTSSSLAEVQGAG